MSFEGPNSHPCTRKTGNADFPGTWVRQAQRVSSVTNSLQTFAISSHCHALYPHQIHSAPLFVCSLRVANSRGTLRKFRETIRAM